MVAGAAESAAGHAHLWRVRQDQVDVQGNEGPAARGAPLRFEPQRVRHVGGRRQPGARIARARPGPRRHIYAEVLGYTLNNDAFHMSSSLPGGEAALAAMHYVVDEAKLRPDQIDYVNAHASSTPMNDGTEARAVSTFFGGKTPAVSGTKAYYGHPLGASGAIEAALCCLAIQHSHIPPTLNCLEPCPEITPGFDPRAPEGPFPADQVCPEQFVRLRRNQLRHSCSGAWIKQCLSRTAG